MFASASCDFVRHEQVWQSFTVATCKVKRRINVDAAVPVGLAGNIFYCLKHAGATFIIAAADLSVESLQLRTSILT